jgi:hypothetical protein
MTEELGQSPPPELIPVPSGQAITLVDVIMNEPGPEGVTVRFRFLAPAIGPGGGIGFDVASLDMMHLCETYVLPRVAGNTPAPSQVIVSISDVEIVFGEAAPEATQFFEAYRIEEDRCIWEAF